MTTDKQTRPTPQSLPRLQIPASLYEQEPEEITTSRADEFLRYCREHNRAPPAPVPRAPSQPPAPSRPRTPVPRSLAFTEREWEELDARTVALAEAKQRHTECYDELRAFARDRNAVLQCRRARFDRQRIDAEIEGILRRREVRREFRRDFNHVEGLENW
ncbi:hypothetical protein GGR52DRAFT_575350 [Hypoxylon sp. FL1284]|nr:hypothetical protein GGR52DRAFT_575350 [Hypoxylon sp. FL1284]